MFVSLKGEIFQWYIWKEALWTWYSCQHWFWQTLYMPHFIAICRYSISYKLFLATLYPVTLMAPFFQQLVAHILLAVILIILVIFKLPLLLYLFYYSDLWCCIVTVWDACIWPQTVHGFCSTDWLFLSSALSSGFLILIHNSIEIRPVKNPTMVSKRLTERMSWMSLILNQKPEMIKISERRMSKPLVPVSPIVSLRKVTEGNWKCYSLLLPWRKLQWNYSGTTKPTISLSQNLIHSKALCSILCRLRGEETAEQLTSWFLRFQKPPA